MYDADPCSVCVHIVDRIIICWWHLQKRNPCRFLRLWIIRKVMSDSLTPWSIATKLLCPWDSPGKNIGVGCQSLLQMQISKQQ